MQIALPRTHDAGKLQEQLQQRGQLQHDLVSQQLKKEEQIKQSAVVRHEEADKTRLRDGKKEREEDRQNSSQKKKQEKELKVHHPYKGTKVDFSG